MAEVKECKNDESKSITTKEECETEKCIFVGNKCYLPPGKLISYILVIFFSFFVAKPVLIRLWKGW